jgi:hypothetical protein
MPMNTIQFQPGLCMQEFQRQYGSDEQCEAALFASRWPSGWVCPHPQRAPSVGMPGLRLPMFLYRGNGV